jgi:MoxR-like ATPase
MAGTNMQEIKYEGKGGPKPESRNRKNVERALKPWDHPRDYIAGDNLADAVNAAIYLQQPLLVTGEPGSGKTQLAYSIAWELDLPLHVFHTKMNSGGDDLLYSYDALLRFHDANTTRNSSDGGATQIPLDVRKYVTYNALGTAIRMSRPPSAWNQESVASGETWEATRSIVLIDEIDKAPRDFPNDILYETDQLSFKVKETRWNFDVDRSLAPIVIVTSNQERTLPDAFLRRCVFFYISFPEMEELREIVRRRLRGDSQPPEAASSPSLKPTEEMVQAAVARFGEIRKDDQLLKKPATAELISWIRVLTRKKFAPGDLTRKNHPGLAATYTALLKTREDLDRYAPKFAAATSSPAANAMGPG